MINILISNLLGYDLIILLIAIINGFFIYPKAKKSSQTLREHLQPKVYVPINLLLAKLKGERDQKLDLNAMKSMRSDELHYYSIFVSINSAFPMLGMLGTILSLLSMIDLAQQQVVLNFTVALTSTFWGLVCALVFKGIDATLNPMVDQNQENLKMILERLDAIAHVEASHETL